MTLRSILVPLDGTQFGEYALPYALCLALRAKAKLELVHVKEPVRSLVLPDTAMQVQSYLDDVAQRVKIASPSVMLTTTLLHGSVADTIYEYTTVAKPDLIVLTTHGRGPLSRLWLGSVANDLVQRIPAPVLLVRPQDGPPNLTSDPAPRRILIPLDGSPYSEQIIPLVVAVGGLAGAEYWLLTVVPPVITSNGSGHGGRTMADQLRAEAYGYLAGITHRIPAFRTSSIHVTVDWPPATVIVTDAESIGIDLIAITTRRQSSLAKLLLGSVADKVVRGASVPVLLQYPIGG